MTTEADAYYLLMKKLKIVLFLKISAEATPLLGQEKIPIYLI